MTAGRGCTRLSDELAVSDDLSPIGMLKFRIYSLCWPGLEGKT